VWVKKVGNDYELPIQYQDFYVELLHSLNELGMSAEESLGLLIKHPIEKFLQKLESAKIIHTDTKTQMTGAAYMQLVIAQLNREAG